MIFHDSCHLFTLFREAWSPWFFFNMLKMPKRILTKVKFAQPPSWSAGCLSSPATSWTRSASSSHSTRPLETFSSRLLTITMHYLYNQRDNLDWKLLEKTEMELIEFNQTGLNWPQRDLTMRWFRLWRNFAGNHTAGLPQLLPQSHHLYDFQPRFHFSVRVPIFILQITNLLSFYPEFRKAFKRVLGLGH